MEEGEPGAKRSRLADEWSESGSDGDSDDDGGDDLESTSDDNGQKPCPDMSLARRLRSRSIKMIWLQRRCHSSILPAQPIVSIQCQISRASLREKYLPPWLAGCWTARRYIVACMPCWCDCEDKISF